MPTSVGSLKKQKRSRKTSISSLLTMPKPWTVWIATNWKILQENSSRSGHLTCLLRNLYTSQEATVRTIHGTTDWFQIGKGVRQGCLLSLCLFKLYAEYIMLNAGLNETQAGIKIAGRNINNLTSLSLFTFMHWRRKWQPTPVFLPGESQGWGSLVSHRLWGRTESDTTEAT